MRIQFYISITILVVFEILSLSWMKDQIWYHQFILALLFVSYGATDLVGLVFENKP